MKLKAFAVRNVPYERIEGIFVSPSAGLAIRDNSMFLAKVSPHFQEDLKLFEIGEFNDDGTVFSPLAEMQYHSWDEYKEPEVPVVPLGAQERVDLARTPDYNQRPEADA